MRLAEHTIEKLRGMAATPTPDGNLEPEAFFLLSHLWPSTSVSDSGEVVQPGRSGPIELPRSFAETFEGKPMVQQGYAEYWSTDSFSEAEWKKLTAVYWGYVAMIDHEVGRILAALDWG
ncbi:hypothetical protein ARUE_232p01370 (plasmid) [Arthrobacter sp. Rue61a]|nr:hypothetical protein ARUE_232p01370 [Arthrobacter sp. Rue61a]